MSLRQHFNSKSAVLQTLRSAYNAYSGVNFIRAHGIEHSGYGVYRVIGAGGLAAAGALMGVQGVVQADPKSLVAAAVCFAGGAACGWATSAVEVGVDKVQKFLKTLSIPS